MLPCHGNVLVSCKLQVQYINSSRITVNVLLVFTVSIIVCSTDQVAESSWPCGPTDLAELFRWGDYNATRLLQVSDARNSHIQNFASLLDFNIVVNDSYAGMGTAGYTLHLQHQHLLRSSLSTESTFQFVVYFDDVHNCNYCT